MFLLLPSAAVALAFSVLGFAYWLWRRLQHKRALLASRVLAVTGAGFAIAIAVIPMEDWVLRSTAINLVSDPTVSIRSTVEPLLAMLLFCVPLEESFKVGVLWPLYLRGKLRSGAIGVSYAVFCASGFAAGEILAYGLAHQASWLILLRVVLSVPAHIFFAGLWGYVLGGQGRDRYFFVSFIGCVVVHAIYDYIVFSRGPALLVVALPMFATMGWGVVALLRDLEVKSSSQKPSTKYSLLQPPTVGSVRQVLDPGGRSLKLHWILIGALVNLGVTFCFLALAVYVGHHFQVDFSLIEDATTKGMLPVLFLAGGLLASFPVSAYLVARASGTHSVLEPAWAMGTSIICVLTIFSLTEPTAIIIALGLAPVGFLLACVGAVFGIKRT